MKGTYRKKRWLTAALALSLVWGSVPVRAVSQDVQDIMETTETETEVESEYIGKHTDDMEEVQTEPVTEAVGQENTEKNKDDEKDTSVEEREKVQMDASSTAPDLTEAETETAVNMSETELEMTEISDEAASESGETELESEEQQVENADPDPVYLQGTLTPSGTPIGSAAGWTAVAAGAQFSSGYRPVKFYPGISSVEFFNSSDKVVFGTRAANGNHFLYPTAKGQEEKFGAVYHKVLYYGQRWYDLRMTVASYTSQTYVEGGKKADAFPYITFWPDRIGWSFNQTLGAMVLRCEFFDSVTGAKTALNTRFQWWDIDAAQRFGIQLADGVLAGRYYYPGSLLYVQDSRKVAGVSGMNEVIGHYNTSAADDARACVTYELNGCSTYYISIGARDHIAEDDGYRYGPKGLGRRLSELAAGVQSETYAEEYLVQTDSGLSVIETPAPGKSASGDGTTWVSEHQLASMEDSYWYRISQYVPWQDTNAYYSAFTLRDILPTGVDYMGDIRVIREEDGADVTDWFDFTQDGGTMTASAKGTTLTNASFYGYNYNLKFRVRMDRNKITPVFEGKRAVYTAVNQASLIYQNPAFLGGQELVTNQVRTTGVTERKDPEAPTKSVEGENKGVRVLEMSGDAIVFHIYQEIPENETVFEPTEIMMTDNLAKCLEYIEGSVWEKKEGQNSYVRSEGWRETSEEQNICFARNYASGTAKGSLRFDLTCRIRKNYDLLPWQKQEEDGAVWATIPNRASVSFRWSNGSPSQTLQETNEVKIRLRENHIRLTKEIDTADIVWAHGNPTFTFKVTGEDIRGQEHSYYQTVEFCRENIGEGEKATLTADFVVPSGSYNASEEKTMRYSLAGIGNVKNGTVEGASVQYALQKGGDGTAVFYNRKITDEDESHTAFVENRIGS
ncbi:MAG: isopeptide-forming domain-containing fimbrial protein [Eubacteriales bacterium]|nr:isopeptide-forming domain-containing fimbrial protein [Eubacteriales bacterium]